MYKQDRSDRDPPGAVSQRSQLLQVNIQPPPRARSSSVPMNTSDLGKPGKGTDLAKNCIALLNRPGAILNVLQWTQLTNLTQFNKKTKAIWRACPWIPTTHPYNACIPLPSRTGSVPSPLFYTTAPATLPFSPPQFLGHTRSFKTA